jgi:plasmid stability protein
MTSVPQLTLRIPDDLHRRLKAEAAERGTSVNLYAQAVLAASIDPETATTEIERMRERMRRAGLLAESIDPPEEVAGDKELSASLDQPAVARWLTLAIIEDRGRGEESLYWPW